MIRKRHNQIERTRTFSSYGTKIRLATNIKQIEPQEKYRLGTTSNVTVVGTISNVNNWGRKRVLHDPKPDSSEE